MCIYIYIYTYIYIIYDPYIPIAARPCEGVSGTCLHVQSTLARAAKWLLSRVPLEPKSGNQPISMDVYVGDEGVICFEDIFTGNPLYTDIIYYHLHYLMVQTILFLYCFPFKPIHLGKNCLQVSLRACRKRLEEIIIYCIENKSKLHIILKLQNTYKQL